jgi:hypothetical protein
MGPAPRNLTVAALGHGDHGVAKVAQCSGGLFLGGVSRPMAAH